MSRMLLFSLGLCVSWIPGSERRPLRAVCRALRAARADDPGSKAVVSCDELAPLLRGNCLPSRPPPFVTQAVVVVLCTELPATDGTRAAWTWVASHTQSVCRIDVRATPNAEFVASHCLPSAAQLAARLWPEQAERGSLVFGVCADIAEEVAFGPFCYEPHLTGKVRRLHTDIGLTRRPGRLSVEVTDAERSALLDHLREARPVHLSLNFVDTTNLPASFAERLSAVLRDLMGIVVQAYGGSELDLMCAPGSLASLLGPLDRRIHLRRLALIVPARSDLQAGAQMRRALEGCRTIASIDSLGIAASFAVCNPTAGDLADSIAVGIAEDLLPWAQEALGVRRVCVGTGCGPVFAVALLAALLGARHKGRHGQPPRLTVQIMVPWESEDLAMLDWGVALLAYTIEELATVLPRQPRPMTDLILDLEPSAEPIGDVAAARLDSAALRAGQKGILRLIRSK